MVLYTGECALPDGTHSTLITVEPKLVLTLYCVPTVLSLTSRVTLVQGKWLVLSCPLFGGFTGLECIIRLGGLEPPSPPAPTPLV